MKQPGMISFFVTEERHKKKKRKKTAKKRNDLHRRCSQGSQLVAALRIVNIAPNETNKTTTKSERNRKSKTFKPLPCPAWLPTFVFTHIHPCLLYTSPSPRDRG